MVNNRLEILVVPIDIAVNLAESIVCSADAIDWPLGMLGSLELLGNFHILWHAVAKQTVVLLLHLSVTAPFKNTHKHQLVNPEKMFRMLEKLRKNKNPYYKFYDDYKQ